VIIYYDIGVEEFAMSISYKPLFRLLLEKDMKKTDLKDKCGLSLNVIAKLSKNEQISMESLQKLCQFFNCQFSDIVEYIPDTE
jgi:DNA-binding Xre family transcriptional regulator